MQEKRDCSERQVAHFTLFFCQELLVENETLQSHFPVSIDVVPRRDTSVDCKCLFPPLHEHYCSNFPSGCSYTCAILILMALTRFFLKPSIYGTHQDPWASFYQFIMLPLLLAVISGQLSPETHVSDQLTSKSLSASLSLVKKNRGGDGSKVSAQSFSNTTMMPRINAETSNHMSCSTKNTATFRGEELHRSIWNGCLFDTNYRAPIHNDYCRMLKW